MKFVISYSGGLCSYWAARRIIERHGRNSVILLFSDTLIEHDDLYRFIEDSTADLGVPVTRIADGRTPWDVFFQHRFLGNTRVDLCSRILKRELMARWCDENCRRDRTVICAGLSYGERDRYFGRWEKAKFIPGWRYRMRAKGWMVQAPMMAPPYWDKAEMLARLRERGLEPSDSYEDGFAHDNCGGFCVKQGQKGFLTLLAKRPAVFAHHERREQEFREFTGKNVAILRDRTGGKTKPLTLRVLRERFEASRFDLLNCAEDGAACGCAIDA